MKYDSGLFFYGFSILKAEHLVKELVDIYMTLRDFQLLPLSQTQVSPSYRIGF